MADTTETEQHTGVGVFLIPAAADPITAASSEPAHCTTIWMGDMNDIAPEDLDQLQAEVSAYAGQLDGPVVVPTAGRGVLGADEADVTFLERTDALLALRDGLLQASPTADKLMNAVEQYPEWTPHVTMGYPETPALAEYDGDAVTFDRVGVWIGPDQHEYPMGGAMSDIDQLRARAAALIAAAPPVEAPVEEPVDEEMPLDEPEDGEELITEIPVHGVATLEGKPTGDGRGFRAGALSFGRLPAPLGYEFESSHGGSNSRVSVVGRIDEFWTVPSPTEGEGVFEVRWRGVIMPGKPYGALAIESIVDGSYDGVSIVIDDVTRDVTEERAFLRDKIERDQAAGDGMQEPKDLSIDEIIDEIVGDGTLEVSWYSAARIRRFDMVPTGAFQEGYTALGAEFAEELTDEQVAIAASALQDCGCTDVEAPTGSFIVSFDSRSDDGPVEVGPFDSAEEAEAYLDTLRGPGFSAEYEVRQLSAPTIVAAAFAPGTKDGPGWITHPTATARIRRYWVRGAGAAKIGWGTPGDFDRCRTQLAKYVQNPEWLAGLCSNMHKEALGVWPGQEGGGRRNHGLAASAVRAGLYALVADEWPTVPGLVASVVMDKMSMCPELQVPPSAVSTAIETSIAAARERDGFAAVATIVASGAGVAFLTSSAPTAGRSSRPARGSETRSDVTPVNPNTLESFATRMLQPGEQQTPASESVNLRRDASGLPLLADDSAPTRPDGEAGSASGTPSSPMNTSSSSSSGKEAAASSAGLRSTSTLDPHSDRSVQHTSTTTTPQEMSVDSSAHHATALSEDSEMMSNSSSALSPTSENALVASTYPISPPRAWFQNPNLSAATPLVITDDGRVYGTLASWSTCHVGAPQGRNVCTLAPHSTTGYARFHLGTLVTEEGDTLAVGKITMNTGHAGLRDAPEVAAAHYDNTGAAVADIRVGEDNFGIWVAGALRPDVTPEQVRALRASPLSGDWRPYGSSLELVAALAVNVPGFPVEALAASAAGDVTAIVAAGVVPRDTPVEEGTAALSTTDIAGIAIAAAETVVAKLSAGGIATGGQNVDLGVGEYIRPLAEDTVEDQQEITANLSAARTAFAIRLLADARSAAKSKGI